jgi:putative membrane protein insertion efficiency factor
VRVWFVALLVLVVMIVAMHDVANEPRYSWSGRTAIGAIDSYRAHVSPHLRGYVRCRFTPTCSAYGREAIRRYGFAVGGWKTLTRVARCGPWTKMGTVDPP